MNASSLTLQEQLNRWIQTTESSAVGVSHTFKQRELLNKAIRHIQVSSKLIEAFVQYQEGTITAAELFEHLNSEMEFLC